MKTTEEMIQEEKAALEVEREKIFRHKIQHQLLEIDDVEKAIAEQTKKLEFMRKQLSEMKIEDVDVGRVRRERSFSRGH